MSARGGHALPPDGGGDEHGRVRGEPEPPAPDHDGSADGGATAVLTVAFVLWFERDWAGTGRPLPPEEWRA
ncbi:hypothetical protein, partial [Streptomyces sp. NPDC006324]|uniref:hypothetical protein n=1 Tax=Streptomyces sp. NPDC006324 TaxID=3156751 RepID=UPI0033A8FEC4